MDIKSKSIKPALAFLSFVLGISLLMFSVAVGWSAGTLGWQEINDAFQTDYQQTSRFRHTIESWFFRIADGHFTASDGLTDRNLLYFVQWEGGEAYTNCPELAQEQLPDGYNFLLSFDGAAVTIRKDGQKMEVYGDGMYRPDSLWELPGYQNYPVPSSYSSLTLLLAAAKNPAPFVQDVQGVFQYQHDYDSGLYGITLALERIRTVFVWALVLPLAAGLVLLLLSLVWHKHKVRADQAIAWCTSRIWLEVKVLLLIPFGFLSIVALYLCAGFFLLLQYPSNVLLYLTIPAALWWGYLYVNDLRYGFGQLKAHSLCALLARMLRGTELHYPVGQRICRRSALQFILCLPFFLFCALAALIFMASFWRSNWFVVLLFLLLCSIGAALIGGQLWLIAQNRRTASHLDWLLDRIQHGDAGTPLPEESDLQVVADSLEQMESRLQDAVEEQVRSEKLKLELITNVSHDLKTPLTSMVSYLELLRQEEHLPPHVQDYLQVLDQKTKRLQAMVLDVFDVSKAATGNLHLSVKPIDFAKLLRQTLADQDESIAASPLTFRVQLPQEPVYILADGERLYRVFQNLIGNALQYALEGSRVYVHLETAGEKAVATLRNTSRDELPHGVDFTERFVRGDQSRTDGGSGLGLSIARTFTEACGGSFSISTQADLFTAQVIFPLTHLRPEQEEPG